MSTPVTPAERPQQLRREFSLWSAFAFAFAFISPIVALYGIFGLALSAAGPSFWWGFLLVFSGQFLVRTSPMLHSRLTVEAAEQNVSLNQWVVQKLAGRSPISLLDL